jgi:nitrite reductase/ring-hydroxylating ferredoxin subunit
MNSRRQFCSDACHAALLAGALGPLAACGGGGGGSSSPTTPSNSAAALPRITAALSGSTATINIDSSSPLATVGRAALVQAGSTQLLVARTGTSTFSALTAICTHEACTVTGFEGSRYVCPCHGSAFDLAGRVLAGPAPSPLRAFATSFSGAALVVSL